MRKLFVMAVVTVFLSAVNAQAVIRYVSLTGTGQFTTINAAVSAATSGDTILVGPGNHALTSQINEANKRLTYIGAGWDLTRVNLGANSWYVNGSGANRTSWEGFRFEGSGIMFSVFNNTDSVSWRRCWFVNTGNLAIYWGSGNTGRGIIVEDCVFLHSNAVNPTIIITDSNFPTTIRNCVFSLQSGGAARRAIQGGANSGTVEVYNSVFVNWQTPFALNTSGGVLIAVNNVFYDWLSSPSFGTYNAGSIFNYNASQTISAPGSNPISITTDPFVNYDETAGVVEGVTNLRLDPVNGAVLIDAGHPSLQDFLDNTRSDLGVYGGPKPLVDFGMPNYPWAVNISTTPDLVGQGTPVNASATGRVGPAY